MKFIEKVKKLQSGGSASNDTWMFKPDEARAAGIVSGSNSHNFLIPNYPEHVEDFDPEKHGYLDSIDASTSTFKYPDLNTSEGRKYATKMALRTASGEMPYENVPYQYRTFVGALQNGWKTSSAMNDFGKKFAPVLAGSFLAGPAMTYGIAAYSNPLVRTTLDAIGSIDGIRNAFTDNGISKTIRLAKEGDTWGAVKSGVGDVFDIVGTTDLFRLAKELKVANKAARFNGTNWVPVNAHISKVGNDNMVQTSKQLNIEEVLNESDDLPEWTPSLESHPNEFSYYKNNSENYETGKQAVKNYLQSKDYANQIRKNIPNISDAELQEIVNKQINYIDNSNVWLSNINKLEPWVQGETIHTSGYPEIRIYETGLPNFDRMTAKHEWFHAARGPGDSSVNPFWNKLYWNGLVGKGLSRTTGINKSWYTPANLDLLEFKPHSIDQLSKSQIEMMRYLANSDEARVRALKIRDYMNQTGKTYDEVAKIVSDPKAKGSPIGDIYQLFEHFTPESIKNFVDNVMTIGIPVVGGSMIYDKNSKQKEKPIYLQHFEGNIK